jgi:hypothetical protein
MPKTVKAPSKYMMRPRSIVHSARDDAGRSAAHRRILDSRQRYRSKSDTSDPILLLDSSLQNFVRRKSAALSDDVQQIIPLFGRDLYPSCVIVPARQVPSRVSPTSRKPSDDIPNLKRGVSRRIGIARSHVFERTGDTINHSEVGIFFPELSPSIRRRFRVRNVVDAVKRHETRQKRVTRERTGFLRNRES